jgi:endonuclease YncB( thermonuclease family)
MSLQVVPAIGKCMFRLVVLVAIIISAMPAASHADNTGTATVIDGDTIEIHGQRIRFHGIDAPESRQTCVVRGQVWRCGQQAALALSDFIGRSPVACQEQGIDRYGRMIGVCSVRGEDIEAWMVANGWALAYRKYSLDYTDEEAMAEAAGVGIWRGKFVPPWEWRRGKRLKAATVPENPAGCTIKGNISSSGEDIYHVPGGQYYDRTKINTTKGERWFCTEAEAVAAG